MTMAWSSILNSFPPVQFAFAYGSLAIPQANLNTSNSMIDFIFVVEGPTNWHHYNLRMNPHHYSAPHQLIPMLQSYGAGIYFNTDILMNGLRIKYGVVSMKRLVNDLTNWDTLYLAGRLHKPFIPLISTPEPLSSIINFNRRAASIVSSLLVPKKFDKTQFLEQLVGLSFLGDFRMGIAEDPRKIKKIVEGQGDKLWEIYRVFLGEEGDFGSNFERNDKPTEVISKLTELPFNLRNKLGDPFKLASSNPDQISYKVKSAIASIVRVPAMKQALKGILTAGLSKSVTYSFAKIKRRII